MQKITPCLWFDTQGEQAAKFYTTVFSNSRIVDIARYGAAGPRPEGTVMTVTFELDGQRFVALNGGPEFTFNEAISFQVSCQTQEEVDYFWDKLSEGGQRQDVSGEGTSIGQPAIAIAERACNRIHGAQSGHWHARLAQGTNRQQDYARKNSQHFQ